VRFQISGMPLGRRCALMIKQVRRCVESFFFFFCIRSDLRAFLAYFAYHRGFSRDIVPAAYLRAATLGVNWVHWPSGSDFGQAQRRSHHKLLMFLTWMGSFTCSCIDTRYKEPRFTVPFDGRKEPRMISPMWPGIEPVTCRLLGGCDNH
jgi:hypothetical protein